MIAPSDAGIVEAYGPISNQFNWKQSDQDWNASLHTTSTAADLSFRTSPEVLRFR